MPIARWNASYSGVAGTRAAFGSDVIAQKGSPVSSTPRATG